MTKTRFLKIARTTAETFWPAVYKYLSPEEATYLRTSPAARRNLDARLIRALAETLLTPEQLQTLTEAETEDLQEAFPKTNPSPED